MIAELLYALANGRGRGRGGGWRAGSRRAAGWAVASLEPAAVRRMVAVVLALLSVLAFGGTLKNGEDWQGAAAFEREHAGPDTIVLLHPALVESAQLDWFSDPEKRS